MTNKEFESFAPVLESEKSRIASRDRELLASELKRITCQPGLTTPSCQNLNEYCRWLSSEQPRVVKWDLLRHYAIGREEAYLHAHKSNGGTIVKPYYQDYDDRLLAHTLPVEYWYQAEESGFLPGKPRICFSSGQVVFTGDAFNGMNSMTVIFDREVLEQVYVFQPYSDHDVGWEREIRAHEQINLELALGSVPTVKFLHEWNHWGQLTCVSGRGIMADLEGHYLRTGVLKEVGWF